MDIFFEQAEKEIDLLYLEAVDEFKRQEDLSLISFMESGDVKKKSSEGIFAKIKKMIETAIEKIKAFFTKKQTEENTKKLQEAVKKDPSLKNKKVKVRDYEKILKLNKATLKKLDSAKTKEEADKIVSDYMKKKNAIIAAGAVVVVSVAGVLGFMLHGKDKLIKKLESDKEKSKDIIKKLTDLDNKKSDMISTYKSFTNELETQNAVLKARLKDSEHSRAFSEVEAENYQNMHEKSLKREEELKSDNKKLLEENKALAQSKIIADNCKILMEYTKEYGVVGLKKAMIAFDKWYSNDATRVEATEDMPGTRTQKRKALNALEDINYGLK